MRRRTATNRRLLYLPQHFTAPAADFRRDWLGTLRRIRYSRLQSISSGTQCSRRYRALFPQMTMIRRVGLGVATALIAIAGAFSLPAQAARVGVLSNRYFAETAATFTSNVAGHTFTGVDVSTTTPTLASLQSSFDVVLLFEDGRFPNAPSVGNVVAAYANAGHPVVLGTFYDQDRSDSGASANGWGALESIDPNTTDGVGTPYAARTLNAGSIRSEEHTSELQSRGKLVCRRLLEKKKHK